MYDLFERFTVYFFAFQKQLIVSCKNWKDVKFFEVVKGYNSTMEHYTNTIRYTLFITPINLDSMNYQPLVQWDSNIGTCTPSSKALQPLNHAVKIILFALE